MEANGLPTNGSENGLMYLNENVSIILISRILYSNKLREDWYIKLDLKENLSDTNFHFEKFDVMHIYNTNFFILYQTQKQVQTIYDRLTCEKMYLQNLTSLFVWK